MTGKRKGPQQERPCLMPGCRRKTRRPFGYCDRCWKGTART